MKKLKLNLSELKIQSFNTTEFQGLRKGTVKGNDGLTFTDCLTCHYTDLTICGYTCEGETCGNTCGNTCNGWNTCKITVCLNACE